MAEKKTYVYVWREEYMYEGENMNSIHATLAGAKKSCKSYLGKNQKLKRSTLYRGLWETDWNAGCRIVIERVELQP